MEYITQGQEIELEHQVRKLEGKSTEYINVWLKGLSKVERLFVDNYFYYELQLFKLQAAWRELWEALIAPFDAIRKTLRG